jgi:hypothetical protein
MNDELPKLPSIDFDELNEIQEQISIEAEREEQRRIQERRELLEKKAKKKAQSKVNFPKLFLVAAFFVSFMSLSYLGLTGKLNSIVQIVKNDAENNVKAQAYGQVQGVQTSRTFNLSTTNKIGYISSGNVWIMDYDGKDKHQITRDGGILKAYKNVEWKNSRELSYSACANGECKIYIFSLVSDTATEFLSLQVPQINKIKWSPASDAVLISYVKPNGVLESSMWKDNVQTVLKQYSLDQNYVASFNDEIDFVFSNDGQYFAAVNTLVNSNTEDQVVIYDINASQVATISGESSFPVFASGNNLYFKSENKIFKGKIGSIQSQVILNSFDSYNLNLSKDGNILTYWNLRDGSYPVTSFLNISTGEIKDITGGFKSPRWLNETNVIGLQVNSYKGLYSYDIQKLAATDINGNIRILEENNVTEFDVEGI